MGIQRRQVVIAGVLITAALGWLLATSMSQSMVFYYTVSEVVAQDRDLTDEPLRVAGKVVPGTIRQADEDRLVHRFVIHEGGTELPVVYRGVAPDTFVDDAEAVVEGKLDADGLFHATFLMAKCPSKYESETDYSKFREAGVSVSPQSETSP